MLSLFSLKSVGERKKSLSSLLVIKSSFERGVQEKVHNVSHCLTYQFVEHRI